MAKKVHNLQDRLLMQWKYEKRIVTIFLMNGVPIKGRILEYDHYTVYVGDENRKSLIYKHAISTIV